MCQWPYIELYGSINANRVGRKEKSKSFSRDLSHWLNLKALGWISTGRPLSIIYRAVILESSLKSLFRDRYFLHRDQRETSERTKVAGGRMKVSGYGANLVLYVPNQIVWFTAGDSQHFSELYRLCLFAFGGELSSAALSASLIYVIKTSTALLWRPCVCVYTHLGLVWLSK